MQDTTQPGTRQTTLVAFRARPEDLGAIRKIRASKGLTTASDAIRWALAHAEAAVS